MKRILSIYSNFEIEYIRSFKVITKVGFSSYTLFQDDSYLFYLLIISLSVKAQCFINQ